MLHVELTAVFTKTLFTKRDKKLVQQNKVTYNAQKFYNSILREAKTSTKTKIRLLDLLTIYIIMAKLGFNIWK